MKPREESFNQIERIVYDNAIGDLRKIFQQGPRFGQVVQLLVDEIIEQRRPKFKCLSCLDRGYLLAVSAFESNLCLKVECIICGGKNAPKDILRLSTGLEPDEK